MNFKLLYFDFLFILFFIVSRKRFCHTVKFPRKVRVPRDFHLIDKILILPIT